MAEESTDQTASSRLRGGEVARSYGVLWAIIKTTESQGRVSRGMTTSGSHNVKVTLANVCKVHNRETSKEAACGELE